MFGPYDVSKDPWKNASVQEYLHHYVNQTSAYLLQVKLAMLARAAQLTPVGQVRAVVCALSSALLRPLCCSSTPALLPAASCVGPSFDPTPQGGCDYQVGGVYLWSCGGSWDVIGLSNPVYGQAGSFRDEGAVDIIRAHNEEVQA